MRSKFTHAPHAVRIIGGRYKRTPIPLADVPGLRPSPDRVRVTLFNWIAHLRPDLSRTRGLDLFAGAGSLGFELASRGAEHVTLVEREARLLANMRALCERLHADSVEVIGGDAFAVARTFPEASFDLIFLDPPFEGGTDDVGVAGQGVANAALATARRLLASNGLVYLESATPLDAAQAAGAGFAVVRAARAGRVHFHLLRRADA